MRTIDYTARFKKDYKRELRGQYRNRLDSAFNEVVAFLITDSPLPARLRDHSLRGNWIDHRDCHIFPDLVLIYRKPDETTIEFVRIGFHSELEL